MWEELQDWHGYETPDDFYKYETGEDFVATFAICHMYVSGLRENTEAEQMKPISFVQHFFPATTLLHTGNFSKDQLTLAVSALAALL